MKRHVSVLLFHYFISPLAVSSWTSPDGHAVVSMHIDLCGQIPKSWCKCVELRWVRSPWQNRLDLPWHSQDKFKKWTSRGILIAEWSGWRSCFTSPQHPWFSAVKDLCCMPPPTIYSLPLKWLPSNKDRQAEKREKELNKYSDLLWFWWFSDCPDFHWFQGEVLFSRELRAAIGGAPGPRAAMTVAEITVQPQAEVAMLTAHTLRKTRKQKHQDTQTEWRQVWNLDIIIYQRRLFVLP